MFASYFVFALVASYPLSISGLIPVECVNQQEQECDQSLLPRGIPTSVDQLRDMCRDVQELGRCTLTVYENCMEDTTELGGYRKIADYIESICKEDSEVFQAISSNLECITSNFQNMIGGCHESSLSDPIKVLMTNLRGLANQSQEATLRPSNWCLDTLWRAYCTSARAGISCGFEVGVAVKDMLLQTSGKDDPGMCSPEFLAEATPLLEAVELAIIEQENQLKMKEDEAPARRKRRFAAPFQPFIDFS